MTPFGLPHVIQRVYARIEVTIDKAERVGATHDWEVWFTSRTGGKFHDRWKRVGTGIATHYLLDDRKKLNVLEDVARKAYDKETRHARTKA